MARILSIVILVAFAIGLFVLFAAVDKPSSREHAEFMLPFVTRAIGVFVAAVSLLSLLILAIHGSSARLVGCFAVPLLGGLYLVSPDWGLAFSIGLIAIVYASEGIVTGFRTGHRG